MQFDTVPVNAAEGAILAHSVRADGKLLRKGRVLSADDLAVIAVAGLAEVTVARLGANDVAEDEAAARIAAHLAGEGIRANAAFTGRANVHATVNGVAEIDAVRVNAVNAIHESITLATLAPFVVVTAGQMVATVKIIPFAAPADAVAQAEKVLINGALRVAAFQPHRAALISTFLPGMKESLLDKNRTSIEARLNAIGSSLIFERRVTHETGAVAEEIRQAKKEGCDPILVFGASAITDRRDVIPAAITLAGGTVEHFGMPVDPGNLALVGKMGDANVVGLPGCARSPKLNGFDYILWRLAANLPVGRAEIAAMGVGGLLTEILIRRQPREEVTITVPHTPKIAAVVLAAGTSSRMGSNKLLADLEGKPLIRHAVEAAVASQADPIVVVTGRDAELIRAALNGLDVQFTDNPDYSKGLSTSLRTGVNAVPPANDGALVMLGDMPGITPELIDRMIAGFDPSEERAIVVATRHGKQGNPVLWARRFFPEITAIQGDVGARNLIGANDELVCEIEAADDAPLIDIDTPQMLEAYRAR